MCTTNHSPLPLEYEYDSDLSQWRVWDQQATRIADCDTEEQAALIVRAVNSHDALVKALQAMKRVATKNGLDGCGHVDCRNAMNGAREALAKAAPAERKV